MIGNHVNPQGFPGFESLSLRQEIPRDREPLAAAPEWEASPPFAPPFAPPLDEATIQAAIDAVTRALATAEDEAIPELVAERAALRGDLADLRERGVLRLADERARRTTRR
jgi:hypothetical protein